MSVLNAAYTKWHVLRLETGVGRGFYAHRQGCEEKRILAVGNINGESAGDGTVSEQKKITPQGR